MLPQPCACRAKLVLDRTSRFGYTPNHRGTIMHKRFAALLTLALTPAFCADWNAPLAEHYLDSRQKEWVAWPMALHSGVACVSCHTGLTYLLARPALRLSLHEKSGPTLYESLLVDSM